MKLLNNLRKMLNDDRVLYRIAFCGIFLGMITMYLTLFDLVADIQEDVLVATIQQENMVCVPNYDSNGNLMFICEVPPRDFIKDTMYEK